MIPLSDATIELGRSSGMSEQEIYNIADQFRTVYPETWETLLTDRLMQNKDKSADKKRLAEKKELIRTLENQYYEMTHGVGEEKDLDKRIADLQKRIGKEDENG